MENSASNARFIRREYSEQWRAALQSVLICFAAAAELCSGYKYPALMWNSTNPMSEHSSHDGNPSPNAVPDNAPASGTITPRPLRVLWGWVRSSSTGVGDMLGSGVYALIGKAAGIMGNAVWLAFATSMVAALLTGLSYASLGSRYPRAAGASFITQRAFGMPFLSYMWGWPLPLPA
jgi:hypothetical protein